MAGRKELTYTELRETAAPRVWYRKRRFAGTYVLKLAEPDEDLTAAGDLGMFDELPQAGAGW